MRCVTADTAAARGARAPRPRVILVARTIRAAAHACAHAPPDEVLFEDAPPDLAEDGGLPVPVQLPFAAGLLARARFARLRIDVGGAGIPERVVRLRALSIARIAGVVTDLFALPAAEAGTIVDRFLHDSGFGMPVEPLTALLRAMAARRESSLWDLCGPGPAARVYVDAEGRAAATQDDLRAGRLLGARGDGLAAWRESDAWRAVERFQQALPRAHGACLECAAFPICRGWGAWAGACEQAHAVLARLARAARMLRREGARSTRTAAACGGPDGAARPSPARPRSNP